MTQFEESKALFQEVMDANNFTTEENAKGLAIYKTQKGEILYNVKLILLVLGLVFGFLVFLFSRKLGALILLGVGGILFSQMNLGERKKKETQKTIIINKEQIEIKEGAYKSKRIKIENIEEFETDVFAYEKRLIGKIAIVTKDKKSIEFLELYGEDKAVIEGDLLIIAQHLIDSYFPE